MTDVEVLPVRAEVSADWRPTWAGVMPDAMALAERVADTEFVPRGLRGKPPAILAAIMYGHEIGLPPMQSLARIAVIDGRPSVAAETLRGLILAAGHEVWQVEASNTRVTMAGRRRGASQTQTVTWTMDDARAAGLAGKPNWRAYSRAMLTARATAELARIAFADVIGGMAAIEEMDDDVAASNGDQTAPTKTRTRRRRVASAAEGDQSGETPPGPETSGTPPGPFVEPGPDDPELPLPDEAEPSEPPQGPDPSDVTAEKSAGLSREAETIAAAEAIAQAGEPQMMTDLQRMKMQAMFREKGVRSRESRIAYVSTIAGRPLESSNQLTIDEAGRVIDALEQWNPEDPESKPFPPGTGIPPSGQGHPHTPLPEGF